MESSTKGTLPDFARAARSSGPGITAAGAGNPPSNPALWMDLSELLEQSRLPDPELVDLIEWAFFDGQIDAQKADLAYRWLWNQERVRAIGY